MVKLNIYDVRIEREEKGFMYGRIQNEKYTIIHNKSRTDQGAADLINEFEGNIQHETTANGALAG